MGQNKMETAGLDGMKHHEIMKCKTTALIRS